MRGAQGGRLAMAKVIRAATLDRADPVRHFKRMKRAITIAMIICG